MRSAFRFRLRILLGAICVFALLLVIRLYFVQIVHGSDFSLRAQHQYVSQSQSLYDRGSIYFTRKDGTAVSAATLATGFMITINPMKIVDPEKTYTELAAHATIDHDTFIKSATKQSDPYEVVTHHIPEADGVAIAALKIPGVSILRERWRSYPGGELAAHEIGFVAFNNDNTYQGRYGLEKYYGDTLSRSDSDYRNFFAELFANLGNLFVDARSAREGDVVTTIEPEVEARLMNDLTAVQAKYSSKETGGIVMDPSTGEIIAMGSVPTFNPNDLTNADATTFDDPMAERIYEFGSIVKALTMASGLDSGAITPSTTYNDTGCTTLNASTFCNFDLKARGVIPMQQILSQSLNVGAAWIALQLGPVRMRDYFTRLGMGEKTGVDLPNEIHGLIGNLKSTRQIEYATASFGQGIALTPVEMIKAMSALANHGATVTPHLTKQIILSTGVTKTLSWPAPVQVFKPESITEVSQMLSVVADDALGKGIYKMPSMSFAAKTGTAQLTKPGGGYYKDRYFHSFMGYFPAYNPRYIILLYTNDPQHVEYASETLTSTYVDLMHYLIDYYQVPPDRATKQQ
jgi:cell division protein FtsI/penicillin-binding protein 2